MKYLTSLLVLLLIHINLFGNPIYCEKPNFFMEATSISLPQDALDYLQNVPDENGVLQNYRIFHNRPIDDLNIEIPKRPHIMAVHGGILPPFEAITALALSFQMGDNFCTFGYGTSSIEYRSYFKGLGVIDICSEEFINNSIKTFYRSIHDTRAAINYMFDHADELGIDTSNFFLLGHSLGASSILQAALVEDEIEWLSKFPEYQDLILNDPTLTPWPDRRQIAGIISYAGNLHHLDFLDINDNVPLFLAHGVCDEITPFATDHALSCDVAPIVHGPLSIAQKANEIAVPYSLHSIFNLGHGWPDNLVNESFPIIRDWLKNQVLCGIPEAECFEYYDVEIPVEQFVDCPEIEVCNVLSSNEEIAEDEIGFKIDIFPNPGNKFIKIECSQFKDEEIRLDIFDVQGKQHLSDKSLQSNQRLDSSSLEPGLYYLRFTDGKNVHTQVWVKMDTVF